MERKEWQYSLLSNRGVKAIWVVLGVSYLLQGYFSLDRSDTKFGIFQIVIGLVACFGATFLVPRLNRSRISVDESGVVLPRGVLRSRYVPWESVERLHLHRMGVDLEQSDGKTESVNFSQMTYNTIQSLRPELQSHLKQIAESKGIMVVEHH
jgi:hypothetical protein